MLNELDLTFHALTPERWPDLEKLFGERGACGGCWCMTWRLRRADFEQNKGAGNKRAFQTLVESDAQPALVEPLYSLPSGCCSRTE